MKIRFDLTIEDLIAFTQHYSNSSPSVKRGRLIMTLVIAALFLSLPLVIFPREYLLYSATAGLTAAVVLVIRMPAAFTRGTERQVRKLYSGRVNEGIFCHHELELTSNSLIKRTPVSESSTRFEALGPLAITDDYAFLYASPVTAFVIPRHAVSPSDFDQFVGALKERIDPYADG